MRKNNAKTVLIGIIVILFISAIIIPIFAYIIKFMIIDNYANAPFLFDMTKTISIYDMLLLYFTIVSIGVMGLLTWAIFTFSQKKENDENENKRASLCSEIQFLINQIFHHQNKWLTAFTIRNDWQERICLCHDILNKEQYSKLMEFYGKCNRLLSLIYNAPHDNRKHEIAEEILDEILLPFYRIYKYDISKKNISDATILISQEYIDILNNINPHDIKEIPHNEYGETDSRQKVYKFDKQKNTYEVWDINGKLLCKASIKNGVIWNGYAICYNRNHSKKYDGNYVSGKKNGQGKEYYRNVDFAVKDGYWENDCLINGEMKSVPIGSTGKKVNEVNHIIVEDSPKNITYVNWKEVADYEVIDGILCNEKNKREGIERILY